MAVTVHDILMDADLFRKAYPCWPHAEETTMTPVTPAPVYREGDRVTHLGRYATVTIGNVPDEWGSPVAVSIAYDRAPRGHSPRKDVLASELARATSEES